MAARFGPCQVSCAAGPLASPTIKQLIRRNCLFRACMLLSAKRNHCIMCSRRNTFCNLPCVYVVNLDAEFAGAVWAAGTWQAPSAFCRAGNMLQCGILSVSVALVIPLGLNREGCKFALAVHL